MGLLGPTECQVNTNVTVFRESQQRNYLFLDKTQLVDVFSVSPLPKVCRISMLVLNMRLNVSLLLEYNRTCFRANF